MRLHEKRRLVLVDAGCQVLGCGDAGVAAEGLWLLRNSDRVKVDYAVLSVEVILHLYPLGKRT